MPSSPMQRLIVEQGVVRGAVVRKDGQDIVVSSARAYVTALNKMIGFLSVVSRADPGSRPRASSGSEVTVSIK